MSQLLLSFGVSRLWLWWTGQYAVLQQAGELGAESDSASAGVLAASSANNAATARSFREMSFRVMRPRRFKDTTLMRLDTTASGKIVYLDMEGHARPYLLYGIFFFSFRFRR